MGLIGSVYNSTVTLSKETVKPTVVSTNLNSTADGQNFVIKFSEDLKDGLINASELDASKVSVYDKNNVIIPLDTTTPLAVSGNTLTVKTLAAANPTTQLFKVVLNAGAVQDLVGNKNDAITTYVDSRAAATQLAMGSAALAGTVAINEADVLSADKNVITVNYGINKMGDSAILAANYKLDGAALPVGTNVDFTNNDGVSATIVKITLPEGIYSVASSATLEFSKDIKSDDGSQYVTDGTNDEVATATVELSDNIKPVLTGAKFVASGTDTTTQAIELTFSEGLETFTKNTLANMNDFIVIIGGAEYKITSIGKDTVVAGTTATDIASGDTKVRIAIGDAVNINNTVQVKVVPEGAKNAAINTIDTATNAGGTANGNKLTEGTTVTVTGTVAP